jgi:SulP family sulfate permease
VKILREFVPKSALCFGSGYSFDVFKKDLIAGLTVGVVSLPLAMGFAIASGVSPDKGLITAIVAGFLISLLGGSRVQIGGPTGAFITLIYSIIQRTGYEGLAISTLIAGVILILLGVFKMGSWIKYVPHSLITGFTAGIAVLIFSSQIKDFFGLQMGVVPAEFINKWIAYFGAFSSTQLSTCGVGFATLGIIVLLRKYAPKLPWAVISIGIVTIGCWALSLPVETIHSKFGALPYEFPNLSLPSFTIFPSKAGEIIMNGAAIAFLGAIESLLCCVIADTMMGTSHRSNMELVGQGIANICSILFGGIPATGAIARTVTNVKTGAQTPMAGIVHAVALLGMLLIFAPFVGIIPLPVLSAILIMIAWNMSDIEHFISLFQAPREDVIVLTVSFLLTVFVDITAALTIGMILSSFLFMKKMSNHSKAVPLSEAILEQDQRWFEGKIEIDFGRISVYEIRGPFFFGATDLLKELSQTKSLVVILRMNHVPIIDVSGMKALKEFYAECHRKGIQVLLAALPKKIETQLKKFGVVDVIGKEHIFTHTEDALNVAKQIVAEKEPEKEATPRFN